MHRGTTALLCSGLVVGALTVTACAGSTAQSGSAPESASASGSVAPASPSAATTQATSTARPSSAGSTDALGYASADIIGTKRVTKPDVYGDYGWRDNSPDYPNVADKGVAFKYWGCELKPSAVFNNVVFRLEVGVNGDNGYLDGHDELDRNPVEMKTPGGSGYVHIWGPGAEGKPHYDINVITEGKCKWQLDFIAKASGV